MCYLFFVGFRVKIDPRRRLWSCATQITTLMANFLKCFSAAASVQSIALKGGPSHAPLWPQHHYNWIQFIWRNSGEGQKRRHHWPACSWFRHCCLFVVPLIIMLRISQYWILSGWRWLCCARRITGTLQYLYMTLLFFLNRCRYYPAISQRCTKTRRWTDESMNRWIDESLKWWIDESMNRWNDDFSLGVT